MFLARETFEQRHEQVRNLYSPVYAGVSVLVAAADFEWTVRRAILSLGRNPNTTIRKVVLAKCYGLEDCKRAWNSEVVPLVGRRLPEVVPNWDAFTRAYKLRDRLIHGIEYAPMVKYASERVELILGASTALVNFAAEHGVNLDAPRLRVRRKPRQAD